MLCVSGFWFAFFDFCATIANSDDLSFVYRYNFDECLFLDKYPILKYILSMSYISKDDYQKFLEADVILSRKK